MSFKKIYTIIFCLLMCFSVISIIGCSKNDGVNEPLTIKPTNVYKSFFINLPENYIFNRGDFYIQGERISAVCEQVLNEETSETQTVILSMNTDSSDMKSEVIKPTKTNSDDIISYISSVLLLSDGSIIFIINLYNTETYAKEFRLIKRDSDGNEIFCIKQADLFPENPDQMDIYGIYEGGNDLIYLISNIYITALNSDGTKAFDIEIDDNLSADKIITAPDGRTAVMLYGRNS